MGIMESTTTSMVVEMVEAVEATVLAITKAIPATTKTSGMLANTPAGTTSDPPDTKAGGTRLPASQ